MNDMNEVYRIIQESIKEFVSPLAQIVKIEEQPIKLGLQATEVFRHKVVVQDQGSQKDLFLVTKKASLNERRVLSRLYSQSANVPFNFTSDAEANSPSYVCMQDIDHNTDYRKLNLELIEQKKIPEVMANIHGSNYQLSKELQWLPFANKTYISDMLENRWKPHWEKALNNEEFLEKFHMYISDVKAVAATIIDDMESVLSDESSYTLIHTDIHPGNILSTNDNEVFFIDWAEAHYGTFYLDIPLPFRDLESAEKYHQLLSTYNIEIPLIHFSQQYRTASRYIGLRYMAWTLWDWKENPGTLQSLYNYLNLVVR